VFEMRCRLIQIAENQILEMKQKRSQGVLIKDLMTEYKLSKASVYSLMSESSSNFQVSDFKCLACSGFLQPIIQIKCIIHFISLKNI
jgi:hypothetical protein